MTVHTETIGYQVMSELGMLSSFGKFCQRFSTFVTDSWGGGFVIILWIVKLLSKLNLTKRKREVKNFSKTTFR